MHPLFQPHHRGREIDPAGYPPTRSAVAGGRCDAAGAARVRTRRKARTTTRNPCRRAPRRCSHRPVERSTNPISPAGPVIRANALLPTGQCQATPKGHSYRVGDHARRMTLLSICIGCYAFWQSKRPATIREPLTLFFSRAEGARISGLTCFAEPIQGISNILS